MSSPSPTEGSEETGKPDPTFPGGPSGFPGSEACDPMAGAWVAHDFEAVSPSFSACAGGERLVTYSATYGKWIGAELCDAARYKLFMAEDPNGPFYEIADGGGHGQDHCELVSPSFTIPNDDDIQSGGCLDCAIGDPFVSPPAGAGYVRYSFGEAFTFESKVSDLSYTPDWYSCGVALTACTEPPPPSGPCFDPVDPSLLCGPGAESTHLGAGSATSLDVISVYETHSEHGYMCHPGGAFTVTVSTPGSHVLVLSAYEPTAWSVVVGADATVERVIVLGYHDASVSAPAGTEVVEHSFEGTGEWQDSFLGYDWSKAGPLVSHAEGETGLPLATYHGSYCMSELEL